MNGPSFDTVADLYDLLTDWEKRIPREVGLLDRLFAAAGVKTVLDAACGTGAHLLALSELGYEVAGSDIAPEMVDRTRNRLEGIPGAEVRVADFVGAASGTEPRDAVMVIGNSLPNAGSEDAVRASLAGLDRAVKPGGLLVLHMLNFPALIRSGGGLKPHRRVESNGREYIFLKLFEVHPALVVLDLIALIRDGEEITERLMRSELYPVSPHWLIGVLADLGYEIEETREGFGDHAFDEEASGDLLVVARKPGGDA